MGKKTIGQMLDECRPKVSLSEMYNTIQRDSLKAEHDYLLHQAFNEGLEIEYRTMMERDMRRHAAPRMDMGSITINTDF